jgi:hypothetical protein
VTSQQVTAPETAGQLFWHCALVVHDGTHMVPPPELLLLLPPLLELELLDPPLLDAAPLDAPLLDAVPLDPAPLDPPSADPPELAPWPPPPSADPLEPSAPPDPLPPFEPPAPLDPLAPLDAVPSSPVAPLELPAAPSPPAPEVASYPPGPMPPPSGKPPSPRVLVLPDPHALRYPSAAMDTGPSTRARRRDGLMASIVFMTAPCWLRREKRPDLPHGPTPARLRQAGLPGLAPSSTTARIVR